MSDTPHVPAVVGDSYDALLADLRSIIIAGRGRAASAVTAEMVVTYWRVGERLVRTEQGGAERAAYGAGLLARVGRALAQEFGRAMSERNLQQMRQFYLAYPNANALRSGLTWTHYRRLMQFPDPGQRAFYERLATTGRWSSRELDRQINSMLYERTGLSRRPAGLVPSLPQPHRAPMPEDEAFRDPYVLDFLGLEDTFSERDLEAALVRHIEKFLLELGADFCFVGRQRRLSIGGEDYYVDLVFYHRGLRARAGRPQARQAGPREHLADEALPELGAAPRQAGGRGRPDRADPVRLEGRAGHRAAAGGPGRQRRRAHQGGAVPAAR